MPITFKHFDFALNTALLIWALTVAFTLWAGWLDWRTRKIPNWLTVSGLITGLAVNTTIWGWHGTLASLEGAGLGLLFLFPLVLVRGMGAGDWKLMGAVGALLGPWGVLAFLYVSAMLTGVMAAITVIWTRRVIATLKNIAMFIQGFFVFGWRGNPHLTLDNPGLLKVPFGVAAALTALIGFVMSRCVR
ncbi:MAG TPA: A24 family peptidase [Candidatus Acidoferrales bacterium]|nr:A24 family peptidase [Candidatus Acidoferrales bacterium]